MKIGKQVAVCQDGKAGRAVLGTIVKTHNGNRILVRFKPTEYLPESEHWFRFYSKRYGKKRFGAWCDIDTFCPWYSVLKLKRVQNLGYSVTQH